MSAGRAHASQHMAPALTAFYDPYHNQGTIHVPFTGMDGQLHEFYYQNSLGYWQVATLFSAAMGTYSLSGFADPTWSHVFFIAAPNGTPHVIELYGQQALTLENDLTAASHTSALPVGGVTTCETTFGVQSSPCAIYASTITTFWDGSIEHAFYVDTNYQVRELYYYNQTWWDHSISGPNAAPYSYDGLGLTSVWDGSIEHVFYTGFAGASTTVFEIYYPGGNWYTGNWTANCGLSSSQSPQGILTSTWTGRDSTPRLSGVTYNADGTGAVEALYRSSAYNWTNSVAPPSTAWIGSPAVEFSINGNDHLFYLGRDRILYEVVNGASVTEVPDFCTNAANAPFFLRDINSPIGGFYDGTYRNVFMNCGNDIAWLRAPGESNNWDVPSGRTAPGYDITEMVEARIGVVLGVPGIAAEL
jgi:hypothetical protein